MGKWEHTSQRVTKPLVMYLLNAYETLFCQKKREKNRKKENELAQNN